MPLLHAIPRRNAPSVRTLGGEYLLHIPKRFPRHAENAKGRSAQGRSAHHAALDAQIATLLDEIARDEDPQWGGGQVTPSAYETAWVAVLRDPRRPTTLAFPECLDWLLATQGSDGGWGGTAPYSLLPTLAAVWALLRAPNSTGRQRRALERATTYLRAALAGWTVEDFEAFDTPFFEFLIPLLATELAEVGVRLPIPHLDRMLRRHAEKLAHLPLDQVSASSSPLAHALEALAPQLDLARLQALQTPDGGYGASPSATAAVLLYAPEWDAAAERWLRRLSRRAFGGIPGGMPASYPCDVLEAVWCLHLLLHGGVPLRDQRRFPAMSRLLDWIEGSLRSNGVSIGRVAGLPPDLDDTALALVVLNALGRPSPLDAVWAFERDDRFATYVAERTSSVSANAHLLEALRLSARSERTQGKRSETPPAQHVRIRQAETKIQRYLRSEQNQQGYWRDKWHLSPYYATLSCLLALQVSRSSTGEDDGEREEGERGASDSRMGADAGQGSGASSTLDARTTRWLIETQRPDGGWGMTEPTIEETAYAVLSLCALRAPDTIGGATPAALRRVTQMTRDELGGVSQRSRRQDQAGTEPLDQRTRQALNRGLERGRAFLRRQGPLLRLRQCAPRHEPLLWVDKTLYALPRVTRAATLAALYDVL